MKIVIKRKIGNSLEKNFSSFADTFFVLMSFPKIQIIEIEYN